MNDKVKALYNTVKDQFQQLRDGLNSKLADGSLSIREIVQVVREFSKAGAVIAKDLALPGPEKKEVVIEALMEWWNDPVDGLKKIDLPGPDVYLDPMIEALLPVMAGTAIDWLIGHYNKVGWPKG